MKVLKKNQLQGILILIIVLVVGSSLLSMTRGIEKSFVGISGNQGKTVNSGLLVGRSNRKMKYVVTSYEAVKDSEKEVEVSIPNSSGEKNKMIAGKVINVDKKNKIALIELSKVVRNRKAVSFVLDNDRQAKGNYFLQNNKNILNIKDYQKKALKTEKISNNVDGFFPIFNEKNKIVGAYLDSDGKYIGSKKIIQFLADNKVGVYMNNDLRFEMIFSGVAAINILILYALLANKRRKSIKK